MNGELSLMRPIRPHVRIIATFPVVPSRMKRTRNVRIVATPPLARDVPAHKLVASERPQAVCKYRSNLATARAIERGWYNPVDAFIRRY